MSRSRRSWRTWPGWVGAGSAEPVNRLLHPLDRVAEFKLWGWELEAVLHDAQMAGWVVSRRMLEGWVRSGLLPPPGRRPDRG